MKQSMATLVKFLVHPINGDLFAFFPQDGFTCYSQNGQHAPCRPDYVKECRPATPGEYASLQRELISIGYTLKICK